jgi:hypothetical protein
MSTGVVTPVVPLANDILQGEFKAYANYDLPTQILLGATQGGCKLELDRRIKRIKSDGTYGYQLDSNGVPLVRYDGFDINLSLEQLYLKYFHVKEIASCETTDTGWASKDWAGTGGTYAEETTIVNSGNQSAKAVLSTTAYGIKNVFSSNKNLTAYDNSETSTTSDYIAFSVYITSAEKTNLGTSKIKFEIHKDANLTETNFYYYEIAAADLTANIWNHFKIAKSAFTQTGTASWSAVTGISFKLNGAPTGTTTFYVDSISLLQAQTNSFIVPHSQMGGGFTYTDVTTYRKWVPTLEILDTDYLDNITLVSQKLDGKMVKLILRNCLNDDKLSLALKEKDESVSGLSFAAHYTYGSSTTVPFSIREYV